MTDDKTIEPEEPTSDEELLKQLDENPEVKAQLNKILNITKREKRRKELLDQIQPLLENLHNTREAKNRFLVDIPEVAEIQALKKQIKEKESRIKNTMQTRGKQLEDNLQAAKNAVQEFKGANPELKTLRGLGIRKKGIYGTRVAIKPVAAEDVSANWQEFKNLNQAYIFVNPDYSHSIGWAQAESIFSNFGYSIKLLDNEQDV